MRTPITCFVPIKVDSFKREMLLFVIAEDGATLGKTNSALVDEKIYCKPHSQPTRTKYAVVAFRN